MSVPYPAFDGTQACAEIGPALFTPPSRTEEHTLLPQARRACGVCSWAGDCLVFALHTDVEGIWAGTTTMDRERARDSYGITATRLTPAWYEWEIAPASLQQRRDRAARAGAA